MTAMHNGGEKSRSCHLQMDPGLDGGRSAQAVFGDSRDLDVIPKHVAAVH